MFTGVQASPPSRNSFHVSSSLPACPCTNVYGGRLNHLLMSFPQLSLTITLRNSTVSDVIGFNVYTVCSVRTVHMYIHRSTRPKRWTPATTEVRPPDQSSSTSSGLPLAATIVKHTWKRTKRGPRACSAC